MTVRAIGRLRAGGGGAAAPVFTPLSLFAGGEEGAWYDPSDLTSMFQESAGITPAAMTLPVGKANDKSGRANHAIQGTSAARPTLTARVNLLTYSEQFDNAAWTKTNVTVTANQIAAPDGTTTADLITVSAGSAQHRVAQSASSYTGSAVASVYAKAGTNAFIQISDTSGSAYRNFDISTGALGSGNITGVITAAGSGWYRCDVVFPAWAAGTLRIDVIPLSTSAQWATWAAAGTETVYLWGAQHERGAAATAYQRIAAATDYATAGFSNAISVDGFDDSMTTTAGGGGSTGFFWCGAVKILSGAATARTLWSDAGTNAGYRVRVNASNKLELAAGDGVGFTTAESVANVSVGTSYVLTAWDDGTNLNVQINQGATASAAFGTTSAGTTGFTLGKDNGAATSLANVYFYNQVYRKDSGLTAGQRSDVQEYCATSAGITL
jgi:hypothetical protein